MNDPDALVGYVPFRVKASIRRRLDRRFLKETLECAVRQLSAQVEFILTNGEVGSVLMSHAPILCRTVDKSKDENGKMKDEIDCLVIFHPLSVLW